MLGCGESHSNKNSSSEKNATSTVSSRFCLIRKILPHGGGNVKEFENSSGVKAIRRALGETMNWFCSSPRGGLWRIRPKVKVSTNDPIGHAILSILNSIVQSQGPFMDYGLPQGAAFIPVYLSVFQITFQWLPCLVGTFQLHIKGLSPM